MMQHGSRPLMLSAFARALETFFGPALAAAATASRALAALALAALAGRAMVRAITAWRYGWISVTVVRCPRCGEVAPDPGAPLCPRGHAVRFPPATLRRLASAHDRACRRSRAAYPIVLAAGVCAAGVAGWWAAHLGSLALPVSTITASLAYLFFAAALGAAALALSPPVRGTVARVFHAALAVLCVAPALVLALLARAFEPAVERDIGSLWTTPSALYVSSGRRSRREAPAVDRLDAITVDAWLPGLGTIWAGLEAFHAAGREIPWRGAGGTFARLAGRWLRSSGGAGPVRRSVQTLRLEANRRVRILASRDRIRFAPEP
ncbi:MAG TPA: hypothetical protein VIW03_10650 [Anaeromyxobacter sp.]